MLHPSQYICSGLTPVFALQHKPLRTKLRPTDIRGELADHGVLPAYALGDAQLVDRQGWLGSLGQLLEGGHLAGGCGVEADHEVIPGSAQGGTSAWP